MRKSPSLDGYAHLVSEIEKRVKSGIHRDKAIKEAVTFCIEQGILAEFLRDNYEEVCKMLGYEYNAEAEVRVIKDESRRKGEATRAFTIARNMMLDGEPVEKIIRYTGLTAKEVESLRS